MMTSITVPRSREDTLTVVKAALERVDSISTYVVDGETIIAKTGHRPLRFRFGSIVTIEIPENQEGDSSTLVFITEEVDAGMNFRSRSNFNPDSRIIEAIEDFDGAPIHRIEQAMNRQHTGSRSKEVDRPRDQAGGTLKAMLLSTLYALGGIVLMLFVLFVFSP